MVEEGVVGSACHNGYQVTIQTMAGDSTCLPWLQDTDTVYDLESSVQALVFLSRCNLLIWGTVVLEEPCMRLDTLFRDSCAVVVTLLRRPFTQVERVELHKKLVRATIAGEISLVRELLREGAQVNFDDTPIGNYVSVTLDHCEDNPEKPLELLQTVTLCSDVQAQEPARESDGNEERAAGEDSSASEAEEEEKRAEVCSLHPCGGLSPLLVALVAGHFQLANNFRRLGSQDVDLKPSTSTCIKDAFARKDFPDMARHMAQGADLNVRMARGRGLAGALDVWAIWPGSERLFGTPLHACVAMHKLPGAFETAQLLIKLGADLNAGDAEADSPSAHARYFRANEMHALYTHKGAKMLGPYYRRR